HVARRLRDDLYATVVKQALAIDQESLWSLLREAGKCKVDLVIAAGADNFDLLSEAGSRRLQLFDRALGIRIIGIGEHGKALGPGVRFREGPEPLASRFLAHGVDTGNVAAGPVEAGQKAKRDRVAATAENDRNCRSRGFGSKRRFRNTGADHDRDTAADQIGCQAPQPFRFVIRPPVFDLHVAAFEETNLVEPLAECRQPRCARLRTTRVEIPDHRHRRLLRARRERMRRIGVLMGGAESDPENRARLAAFLDGLQQLGWTDGRNLRIDIRWPAASADRNRTYAAELGGLAPDVILASASASVAALQQSSRSAPIVFANVIDPVGAGFV